MKNSKTVILIIILIAVAGVAAWGLWPRTALMTETTPSVAKTESAQAPSTPPATHAPAPKPAPVAVVEAPKAAPAPASESPAPPMSPAQTEAQSRQILQLTATIDAKKRDLATFRATSQQVLAQAMDTLNKTSPGNPAELAKMDAAQRQYDDYYQQQLKVLADLEQKLAILQSGGQP